MRTSMRYRVRATQSLARGYRSPKCDTGIFEVAQLLWRQLDTPLSLGLSLLLKNGQVEDVVRVKFDPSRYLDIDRETARDDYQAIAFLQKAPLEIAGVDREEAAFKKFLEAEEQCRATNARFRNLQLERLDTRSARVIGLAQHKIAEILGPRVPYESWALRCRFGPGVDSLNKGRHASTYHKLSRQSVTAGFYDGAQGLICDHPVWRNALSGVVGSDPEFQGPPRLPPLSVAPGNTIMFVPKTALTERSIAVEPGMNIYAQLGLGALLRQRLKRAGLDLDNADPNRSLACRGSLDGTVATIDLSMASDTLAREVVRYLLPEHWYFCLNICRSFQGVYRPGTPQEVLIRYEKFSSMGNGYTFELESLIFYSLAWACTVVLREDASVVRAFGDDITCPAGVVPLLAEVLSFCGFTLNPSKSFSSGVFRESCGMDFWKGVNIRPYFLKEGQLREVRSLFKLANGLRRVARRRNCYFGCDSVLRRVWSRVVSWIPPSLRALAVPPRPVTWMDEGLKEFLEIEDSDAGLVLNLDEASASPWVLPSRDTHGGWLFASVVEKGVSFHPVDYAYTLLYAVYSFRDGAPGSHTSGRVPVRGSAGCRLATGQFAPFWPDLGPWI